MAYSVIQQEQASSLGSATSLATPSITATGGNALIVVAFCQSSSATCTITDGRSNAFTEAAGSPNLNVPFGLQLRWFYCLNATGGSGTVTATWSTSVAGRAVYVAEVSGLSAFADDASSLQETPGTSTDGLTSGNATPSAQPALLFGFSFDLSGAAIPTAGTSFTSLTGVWDFGGSALARPMHRRLTSTADVAATATAANNVTHITLGMIFTESGGGGGGYTLAWIRA